LSKKSGSPDVAPRKESEQIIANVWQEVLQQEKIGIYANFFDIGGRSLAVVAVCDKLQKLFDGGRWLNSSNLKLSVVWLNI